MVDLEPVIGYLHRGAEKLSENCDYRQAIGFQDRTEYLSQFNAEQCYVIAVEKLMGLEVPERAEYIRVILTELNRIASHLMFMGAFSADLGVFGTLFMYAFREREHIQDLFEEVTRRPHDVQLLPPWAVWPGTFPRTSWSGPAGSASRPARASPTSTGC